MCVNMGHLIQGGMHRGKVSEARERAEWQDMEASPSFVHEHRRDVSALVAAAYNTPEMPLLHCGITLLGVPL